MCKDSKKRKSKRKISNNYEIFLKKIVNLRNKVHKYNMFWLKYEK